MTVINPMKSRIALLLWLLVSVLALSGCATDNSVKTPVPPAPTNHLAQN